ncbi:MAG: hypothetical protein QM754_05060 [Tepidisphaeraceae bacterium]
MIALVGLTVAGADAPQTGQPLGEPGWSNAATDVSPAGNVAFHGPFCNDAVLCSWDRLPPHELVRVEYDLLILRTWDGSVQYVDGRKDPGGPDYFRCSVAGGPILLSTTFSNLPPNDPGFKDNGKTQNYPSPIPGDLLPPKTGATAVDSMGYHYPNPGPPALVPMDATYHITLLVPHKQATLAIKLEAFSLQSLLDESWGVKDVKVTPLTADQAPPPDAAGIAAAFATALEAAGTDQPAAVNTLVAGTDVTAAWIAQNVQPHAVDPAAVAQAITDLGGDDQHMDAREAANENLFALGPAVEPYLRDALAKSHGETAARIEKVLSRLGVTTIDDADLRRLALATRVLEVIGTPAALEARKHLVGVNP